VGRVEVFVFTEGWFHQRVEGLGEHMLQLQQGAEIRPCIELEKAGNHRQGGEGGEPGNAHQVAGVKGRRGGEREGVSASSSPRSGPRVMLP
jgi:hypothetical protein